MNFDVSDDDAMLKALGERFVLDRYAGDRRRAYLAEAHGFSAENWALLGELGLIAALGAPDGGDMTLPISAVAVLFECLGRGLVVEPLLENVLLGARLFAAIAPQSLRSRWLPPVLSGERRLALAEADAPAHVAQLPGGLILTGKAACVPAGEGVSAFIVIASENGQAGGHDDKTLLFIPAHTAGLTITSWRMADGSGATSLTFDKVFVPQDHILTADGPAVEQAQTVANLARGAEAVGIMERLFADTLDYLRTREQFGVKIGSFQAIQHRMAAQYVALEQARALLNLALVSHGTPAFGSSVAGLRAFVGSASITLGHEMIQFHGGMGVTDELAIGQGHKRLLVLSRWPDHPDIALDRVAGIDA